MHRHDDLPLQDYVAAHVGAKLSTVAIVQRSSFSGNSAMNGGSAINLVSNGRYDQATESAWISDWYASGRELC